MKFEELALDYFGHKPSPPEAAACAIRLHDGELGTFGDEAVLEDVIDNGLGALGLDGLAELDEVAGQLGLAHRVVSSKASCWGADLGWRRRIWRRSASAGER